MIETLERPVSTQREARTPSALDDYLFDLRGYLIVRNAVDVDLHIAWGEW